MSITVEVYASAALHALRDGTSPEYCGKVLEGFIGRDEDDDPTLAIITPEGLIDVVCTYRLRVISDRGLSNVGEKRK